MRVNSVEPDRRKKDRLNLFLEDGRKLSARAEDVVKLHLSAGSELDVETEAELAANAKQASARTTAVNVLSYKPYSKRGLEKRLVEKGIPEEEAKDSTDWLEGMGLLNDEDFALSVREHYLKSGCGASRIRQEMLKRGVSREFAYDLTEGLDCSEVVSNYLASRLKGRAPDRDEIRRLTDALLRRGHSYEDIRAAFKAYGEELEEF
jgi:regulatory protein